MSGAGAHIVNGEGLICQEAPDDITLDKCKNIGEQIAKL